MMSRLEERQKTGNFEHGQTSIDLARFLCSPAITGRWDAPSRDCSFLFVAGPTQTNSDQEKTLPHLNLLGKFQLLVNSRVTATVVTRRPIHSRYLSAGVRFPVTGLWWNRRTMGIEFRIRGGLIQTSTQGLVGDVLPSFRLVVNPTRCYLSLLHQVQLPQSMRTHQVLSPSRHRSLLLSRSPRPSQLQSPLPHQPAPRLPSDRIRFLRSLPRMHGHFLPLSAKPSV
jgi:hypothetical protein